MLESKALQANLQVTAVDRVDYDARYQVLLEAVSGYQGVTKALDHLLFELHHPYLNWQEGIGDLRSFALRNLGLLARSEKSVEALRLLMETFSEIIDRAPKETQKAQAIESLLAFLEKSAQTLSETQLSALQGDIAKLWAQFASWPPALLRPLVRSYHPVAHIVHLLADHLGEGKVPDSFWQASSGLLAVLQKEMLAYWLGVEDPIHWLHRIRDQYGGAIGVSEVEEAKKRLAPVSHHTLRIQLKAVTPDEAAHSDREAALRLADLPGHLDIVRRYRQIAHDLSQMSCHIAPSDEQTGAVDAEIGLPLLFLFHLVDMDGLVDIHEEILRQINRALICYVRTADFEHAREILAKNFDLLKQQVGSFPKTALQCIEALGTEVFQRGNERIIEYFLGRVVHFGFQCPGVQGVDTEWHILSNPAHLQNLRVWLKIINYQPKACRTLLSALILNLKLCGTCIRDTDLFQRDVSALLNSDIAPVYNLAKQLAKNLPVYFNEIGAEGLLRDVSTELDEISRRQDKLIHFLRKQSHVESNNLIVDFIEAILCFWYSKEKQGLQPFLPPEILEQVSLRGRYVDHIHRLVRHLAEELGLEPFATRLDKLLNLSEDRLAEILAQVPDVPVEEKRRLELLVRMYRLETLKYQLGTQEIRHHLEEAKRFGFKGLNRILEVMAKDEPETCLEAILDELEQLKGIILSRERFDAVENIYHKRHIAADIPSMYGQYHERKFDALSLTFRLENLANVYFERLNTELDLPFITRVTFDRILRYLKLFWRAIQLDGVHSKKFATYLTLLERAIRIRRFTFSQYLDVVRGLSEGVKDMIFVYYIEPHQDNLGNILGGFNARNLLPKYHAASAGAESAAETQQKITERVLRDLIAGTFGLQYLDNFIARIYQILNEQREVLDEKHLDLLLTYNPDNLLCPIHHPAPQTNNLIHLGNKGFNLAVLAEEGLPIPPGVIITTELFRCYPVFQKFPRVYRDFKRQLRSHIRKIERKTGRKFGDPSNPLLLSVRSGAAISMPGMMATIISVGSTPDTIEGLAHITQNEWFAWDNYRRFLQSWAMSFGMNRDVFTDVMVRHKRRYAVEKKREFAGEQMKEVALGYRQAIADNGLEIEENPFEQLLMAIRLVLGSWDSEKSRAYRHIMGISDHWGTAVIIQTMAYGNLSLDSGTGVAFTANPQRSTNRVHLWGDFTPGNQGEDIVSGLVSTFPISVEQKKAMALNSEPTLEESFPEIYGRLEALAQKLIYEKNWNAQEIEFTFEGPQADQLYILQTRDMTTKKRASMRIFGPQSGFADKYLGRGIGVSGGALSGKAVFTLEEIEAYRAKDPSTPLILIRSDTVPDDIREISMADGLLTAKGGQTSHAAIVAFRLDKTCVVGCKQLQVFENRGLARIHGQTVHSGEDLSIDGASGSVYLGHYPTQNEEILPFDQRF